MLNLGIEGIMTAGAMTGWLAVYRGPTCGPACPGGRWSGMAMGLLHGLLTVPLGLSQHVTGIGITLLGTSVAYYTYRVLLPGVTTPPQDRAFPRWPARPARAWPYVLGRAPDRGSTLAFAWSWCPPGVAALPHALGLAIRAAGENPAAVEAQGIDVYAVRIGAVVAGSALMAVGGAFLTLSAFNAFFFGMVNGRGWICIALVVFASWRPGKALLGALLFGAFDAFQVRLQQVVGGRSPTSSS